MSDQVTSINLSVKPTEVGFHILAINAGVAKGHDIEFTPEVLKSSLGLWNSVPCMLDHPGLFDNPSVRDLAGSLRDPVWDDTEKGITVSLKPGGPAGEVLMKLREAAKSDPAIMSTVGFSAVLRASVKANGKVERILQVSSVDCASTQRGEVVSFPPFNQIKEIEPCQMKP
jgi:hypothetical protein